MTWSGDEEAPELVFGVVAPVGSPAVDVIDALEKALPAYAYTTRRVKLSRRLLDFATAQGRGDWVAELADAPENKRVEKLMDLGDRVCHAYGTSAGVLVLGVQEMRAIRLEVAGEPVEAAGAVGQLPRTAWIIDSFKRPAEVTTLREIYGDRFVVVAVQASEEARRAALTDKIRPKSPSMSENEVSQAVTALLHRDLSDPFAEHGQNIVKTFPLADLFVDASADIPRQVERFVQLLFGDLSSANPSQAEHGMQLAFVASTTSTALGLKVGAALFDDDDIVSLGANAHPTTPHESPAFDESKRRIEALVLDTMYRLDDAGHLSGGAAGALASGPDGFVRAILDGPLKGGQVRNLTEFHPVVHAEMAALLSAARAGQAVSRRRMFVTAYPCHVCATHLLRCEVDVTYLEPYPKSLAEAMYGQAVDGFTPFTGIAPRRYTQLFATTEDRKGPDGVLKTWSPQKRSVAWPVVDPFVDHSGIEAREALFVSQAVAPRSQGRDPSDRNPRAPTA